MFAIVMFAKNTILFVFPQNDLQTMLTCTNYVVCLSVLTKVSHLKTQEFTLWTTACIK